MPRACAWRAIRLTHSCTRRSTFTSLDTRCNAPRLRAGKIENFIDEREQMARSLQKIFDPEGVLFAQRTGFEELAEAEDGVEGRAQFVAHARKELALGVVRFFRLGTGFFGEELCLP